eukprot:SAG22_NODE_625_length_8437_cov_5.263133_1_plen_149_part_10
MRFRSAGLPRPAFSLPAGSGSDSTRGVLAAQETGCTDICGILRLDSRLSDPAKLAKLAPAAIRLQKVAVAENKKRAAALARQQPGLAATAEQAAAALAETEQKFVAMLGEAAPPRSPTPHALPDPGHSKPAGGGDAAGGGGGAAAAGAA